MSDLTQYLHQGATLEMLQKYEESLEKHIKAVQEAGKKLGVPRDQLAEHDESKYEIAEFPYYARQFHGDAGDPDGFASAWLHHLHANKHHWQYWIFPDDYRLKGSSIEEGGVMEMPEHYALEMVADWMGASYVYTGSWDMTDWLKKNQHKVILHSRTTEFVRSVLDGLGYEGLFKSMGDR